MNLYDARLDKVIANKSLPICLNLLYLNDFDHAHLSNMETSETCMIGLKTKGLSNSTNNCKYIVSNVYNVSRIL
jgi:hypothetical protein